jgi:predicted glycoside hydrolase/deacetylase ChbG (UPF0249 family)
MASATYAERLGWQPEDRVVIFHIDDTGMSHASNAGTIKAMEEGLATSCSIMMPCSWATECVHYWKQHPEVDAGMHVTLTSEWTEYRWGPVAGKSRVPGLVDVEGCLWPTVPEVVAHATPDEVEAEIRAQMDRMLTMGVRPTHLDTHMGCVFGSPEFMQRYLTIGIEHQIPVFLPGGHLQYLAQSDIVPPHMSREMVDYVAQGVWDAGLPVLDDCHLIGCASELEAKIDRYAEVIRRMQPGLTQVIMHASEPTDAFPVITDSSEARKGELELMLAPRFKNVIAEEGIILTTWRELAERRKVAT